MPHSVVLEAEDDWQGWCAAVRGLIAAGIRPEDVTWRVGGAPADLFDGAPVAPVTRPTFAVSRAFLDLARLALLHRDPERFALLHGLLSRVLEQPHALRDRSDRRTRRLEAMAQAVGRDMHKMRAFVRFRLLDAADGPRHVAWFEPEHHILRANAGFFLGRFTGMRWSILTPDGSLHWDGAVLREGPGAERRAVAVADPVEAIWKSYFVAIFNPARLKPGAMLKEMPKKYWANLPEATLIPEMIAGAWSREQQMLNRDAARMNSDARGAAAEAGPAPERR